MQSRKTLFTLMVIAFVIAVAAMRYATRDVVVYPSGGVVFDRNYDGARKIFQVSDDAFVTVIGWYEQRLADVHYERKKGLQEGNVSCTTLQWVEGSKKLSVVVCDHAAHRTISTLAQ